MFDKKSASLNTTAIESKWFFKSLLFLQYQEILILLVQTEINSVQMELK